MLLEGLRQEILFKAFFNALKNIFFPVVIMQLILLIVTFVCCLLQCKRRSNIKSLHYIHCFSSSKKNIVQNEQYGNPNVNKLCLNILRHSFKLYCIYCIFMLLCFYSTVYQNYSNKCKKIKSICRHVHCPKVY